MGGAAFRHPAATVMLFRAPTDIAARAADTALLQLGTAIAGEAFTLGDERHVIMNRYLARMNAQDIPAGLPRMTTKTEFWVSSENYPKA